MEEALKQLLGANQPLNRVRWALDYKKAGKKVVGILCSYVPGEIIYAAGMLPWRIQGTWRENTPHASVYRSATTSPFGTHVLESLLTGEFDFLDGVIGTSRDQDLVRTLDVWEAFGKTPFTFLMHLPHREGSLARQQMAKEYLRMVKSLEQFSGVTIQPELLDHAISVYNRSRQLIAEVYELRKKKEPPLSGSEFLQLTTAATVMPGDEFNRHLEALLPYLRKRKTPLRKLQPRIMVSSDFLDNPAYLGLIEDSGCLVAMDDLDTGSRYFWREVSIDQHESPYSVLAERYLSHPASPHFYDWSKQLTQVIQWAKEFAIEGVIELPLINDTTRLMRAPFFREGLTKAGIPCISLLREYHFGNAGQLKTRIEAFLEMLVAKTEPVADTR